MHYALALLPAAHLPTVLLHTRSRPCHTHTHTHHTHTHTHTHAHTHAHTHIHKHTDWACTTCSDFGFLFHKLLSRSTPLHECTHWHCYVNSLCTIFITHTHTHNTHIHTTHTYTHTQHTHTHTTHTHTHTHNTHIHTHTLTGLVPLAVTLGSYMYFLHRFHKGYMLHPCVSAHAHTHTQLVLYTYIIQFHRKFYAMGGHSVPFCTPYISTHG